MYTVSAQFSTNAPVDATNVKARRVRPTPIELSRNGPYGRELRIVGLPTAPGRDLSRVLDDAVTGDLEHTTRVLSSLDGAFAAFVWDTTRGTLLVLTDFLGSQPLYMRRSAGRLAFAPTIRELADPDAPDPAGWGAFVGLGHFIGARTSAAGVTRVTPATILEYEPATDRLSRRTYWRWPDVDHRIGAADIDTRELAGLLAESVRAYEPYGTRGTLLLSGGFESRLLAGLMVRGGWCPTAMTLRNPYEHLEIDGRFAARVARELGLPHDVRDPDPSFFSTDTYLDYVRLSDVATTSVNLFIAQVYAELQAARVEASWDGVCYGTVIKDKSEPSFEAFLARALKSPDSPEWHAARRVFSPSFVDAMQHDLHGLIAGEVAQCHEGPPGVAEFFVRNRGRNRTTPNALKVYANFLLPFMPGLTKAFYERAVRIPPALKTRDALYRRILEREFPSLARLPYCSGGHLMPGTRTGIGYRLLAARSGIVEHPRAGNVLRRLGLAPVRPESAVVTRAVQQAVADHEVLNADGIQALQRTPPTGTNEDTFARELLFYWSMWRGVMGADARSSVSDQSFRALAG